MALLKKLARSDFPSDFEFGVASSALQTESLPHEGGRGSSTWDYFIGDTPAVQSYFKYKDDVQCLKNMNIDNYRFSISWPRLIPTGKLSAGVNQNGIDFYNNLIDELIANGIEPFVTLFHFDLPSALQEEYNVLLSSNFVFLDPLLTGDYPFNIMAILRDRLPTFTEEQEDMVKGSFDFIGINYYTSRYTKPLKLSANDVPTATKLTNMFKH